MKEHPVITKLREVVIKMLEHLKSLPPDEVHENIQTMIDELSPPLELKDK